MGADEKKYSGKQIESAGKNLLKFEDNSQEFLDAMDVLSFWRSSHEKPLDIAFDIIQNIVSKIDNKAIYAKRLKRLASINLKLKRFRGMNLKNMQDLGGCRVIVTSKKKLEKVIKVLKGHSSFRDSDGEVKFKDYISKPKDDGYRCYHLVGKFGNNADSRNIEIQVRTALQHDWATALEIIDLFTNQSLKSNNGDKQWAEFFINTSKLFAYIETIHLFNFSDPRSIHEFLKGIDTQKELKSAIKTVKNLIGKLNIISKFAAFTLSVDFVEDNIVSKRKDTGYVLIEIDLNEHKIKATGFDKNDGKNAEHEYTEAEKKSVGKDCLVIALVSTSSFGEIKDAYPNYFADSSEFIKYISFIHNIQI